MATFTTQPFHELLDSDKTTPSTVLDSDGKLKQSLHNFFPNTAIDDDDTGFNTDNITLVESGTSPSGKAAYLMTENSDTAQIHRIYKAPSVTSGRYYAHSIDVKRGSGSRDVTIYLGVGGFGAAIRWNLDLDTGEVTSQVNGTKDAAIATELSDGWWTFTVFAEATASFSPNFSVAIANGTNFSYNGDGTSSIYVSRVRMYEASVHAPVERFENTNFATDTIWVKTNWTIGSGVASKTVGTFGGISQPMSFAAGEKYRIKVTISNYVAGSLTARLSSGSGLGGDPVTSDDMEANGTYVFILTAKSTSNNAGFAGSADFDGDIDDVSITKVINDGIQNDLDGEDFIETSGSAIYHGGLEYNGDGSFRGIQSFVGRTNLLLRSGEIGTTPWSKAWGNGVTATLNSIVSPSGELDATKLDTTDGGGDGASLGLSGLTIDDYYTASVFVKNDDANRSDLIVYLNAANEHIRVNWSGSDISSVVAGGSNTSNARYEDYGDGWYRVSFTVQAKSTSGNFVVIPENDGSNASGSAYFWGAQFEAGSSPSPYIPTDSSTRTRSADQLYKRLSEFGFNRVEYSILAEFENAGSNGSDFPRIWQIDNGTNNIRTQLIFATNNAINYNGFDGSSNNYSTGIVSAYTAYDKHTIFTAGISGDQDAAVDGSAGGTDLNDSTAFDGINSAATTLRLGSGHVGSQANGHLKRLIIWPKKLSDSTIETGSI